MGPRPVDNHRLYPGLESGLTRTQAFAQVNVGDLSAYTPEYAYDLKRDWGNDPVDTPQDFIINSVADVPVGKGKYFASNANWLVNGVIGNWSLTTTFNWHSGAWFTPVESGIDPGNIGKTSGRRINQVPGCNPYGGGAHNKYGLWFNPACFTAPPNGSLGNEPVNGLIGPNVWILVMNPFKEFPLGFREGAMLRIGAQIFNILNHPTYGGPITDLSSPAVGHITSTTLRSL